MYKTYFKHQSRLRSSGVLKNPKTPVQSNRLKTPNLTTANRTQIGNLSKLDRTGDFNGIDSFDLGDLGDFKRMGPNPINPYFSKSPKSPKNLTFVKEPKPRLKIPNSLR